ncbi:glycosyltransferase family 4 protein [Phycicoccus sp. Soil803]|uniref:glycosyltransferase family 4 protein n=1 Tax=Phycicoccus sp. Soil803 TaxID=1736415 RepID=UPI0009EBEA1E|nr:glycosyltransferase family 4 protein [Phycicoccus sp. Soil803]
MRTVHVVVPDSVDDPARPSGGNTYDRRVCAGLQDLGWDVRVHRQPGRWPHPDPASVTALASVLESLPRDAVVLVDGLLASGHPEVLRPASERLRVVVLVHLPLGHPVALDATGQAAPAARSAVRAQEGSVLEAAAAVLTTSRWTADWLRASYDLAAHRLQVARPGADHAQPATGTVEGTALLSVAAVVPAKGHAELLDALATLTDRPWRLVIAGALDLAPDHVTRLRATCARAGITDRVRFAGPLGGAALDREYAAADLLVVPSRIETYGLVVTEALARALPVVAAAVGGVEEAMGSVPDGGRPGRLVHLGGAELALALRSWLEDPGLRERWRSVARERRTTLEPWSATARQVADVLRGVAARSSGSASTGRPAGSDGSAGARW